MRYCGLSRRMLLAGLAAQAGTALAGEPEMSALGPQFAVPTGRDGIGRLVAPVMINGAGPFRFLVDTGANRTAISAGLARRLSLPMLAGKALVQGVTGEELAGQVALANMAADRLVWRDVAAAVIGVGVLDNADGILGADSFRNMRIRVDFRNDKIALAPARSLSPPRGYSIARCRLIKRALLAAPAQINGVRVTAVIDTGAERSIVNSALVAALTAAGAAPEMLVETLVLGVVGPSLPAQLLGISAITIGDLRVRRLNAAYLDAPIFGVWDLEATPTVLLGMDVLGQAEELVIDYAAPALWVRFAAVERQSPPPRAPRL